MNLPHDRRSDLFSDWLEAHVTGTSTADHELEADPVLEDLCAAADQFHGLSERWAQETTISSRSTSTWEDTMATSAGAIAPQFKADRSTERWDRANRFATGALTAAIIIAIGAGAWRASDLGSPGDGGPPPPTTFAAIGQNNDHLPEATVQPDVEMSSIPYPSADECTVEMPSREWVVDHIDETIAASTPTVGSYYEWPIEPTQEEVNGVMATFRMWQACGLSDVPRAKAFTLETPWFTKTQGLVWGQADSSASQEYLNYLTDLALTEGEEAQEALAAAYYGRTPNAPGAMSTPVMIEVLDTPHGGRNIVPFPAGATPIALPDSSGVSWPTILSDDIEMRGPDRARATIYMVDPETRHIDVAFGETYEVQMVRVDGSWYMDYYGPIARG